MTYSNNDCWSDGVTYKVDKVLVNNLSPTPNLFKRNLELKNLFTSMGSDANASTQTLVKTLNPGKD